MSDEPVPTAPSEEPAPEQGQDGLALVDSDIEIVGDTGLLAVAGEQIEVDHLVHNAAAGSRSVAFRIEDPDEIGLDVEVSTRSKRMKAGQVESVTSRVTVPGNAPDGAVYEYTVIALNVDDIDQRSHTTVQVLVVDAVGARPDVGPDAGITEPNERVLVYVIGDDTDPDDDLDITSVRVIAGGFMADELTVPDDGFVAYIPFANVTGLDAVLYEVCDAESRCDTGVVTIEVGDR